MRRFVARLLRRLADRLDPPQVVRVRFTADTTAVCEGMAEAAERLRRAKL